MLALKMVVTMLDQSIWSVPTSVIALHRAKHYMSKYDNDLDKSLKEDTIPLFTKYIDEIEDWAMNNMTWEDVKEYARKESGGYVDYEEGWTNGDKNFINI